ncbi:MAG: hypothetical protein P8Z42_00950 [Anaerolineales bacterium]|jgi:hypothetical protein
MSDKRRSRILPLIPTILLLAALACDFPGSTPTQAEPEASNTQAPNTATATETVAAATETATPEPPTPTDTLAPPSATSTTSPWVFVSGTWSGCVISSGPPTTTGPCSSALGPFVTLYLQPTCLIGQHCGNYVKGAFESEFIRMKLTLIGIDGSTIWMHADAGSGMFSWASTDVKIERVGANVRVTEIAGSGDIVLLPPGCDSKIQTQTTIGCSEHVP